MLNNIYTYLEKIDFENRVKNKVKEIKKVKNLKTFDIVVSDMVMLNWAYGLLSDLFDKIYEDVNNND